MASRLRPHLTYANVVSSVCLFVVLGGSAYAGVTLSKNSVTSRHIKDGQVKRGDIAKDAVTSAKVADASLQAADFATGQLPAGAKGDPGPKGDTGPRGPSDALASFFGSDSFSPSPGSTTLAFLDLDPGAYVGWANAILLNNSGDPLILNCGLGTPGVSQGASNWEAATDVAKVTIPAGAKQTVSLTGALALDASDTLTFDCYPEGASSAVSYEDADIGATQVETLTTP